MPGHLFITRGDLASLACDAVLVPSGTDVDGNPWHVGNERWHGLLGPHIDRSTGLVRTGLSGSFGPEGTERRIVPILDAVPPSPAIWLGHTGEDGKTPAWYAEAVVAFVREAAAQAASRIALAAWRPLADQRPLVALPLVGTGVGGAAGRKGKTVAAIVQAIREVQRDVKVDVALVVRGDRNLAAAQQARMRIDDDPFADLGPELRSQADEIGRSARRGQLVPFVGAGAGIGAGLPSWSQLLDQLIDETDLGEADQAAIRKLDARDTAAVLQDVLTRKGLEEQIRRLTLDEVHHVSLIHQLLASMPVREVVTTNYDLCLENAFADADHALERLEERRADSQRGWLLKLHGSVHQPGSIVLSRDDYLRFEGEGVALAGVVQAMLLTRHLLFVGYSLSDDNFHRLVHQAGRVAVVEPAGDAATVRGGAGSGRMRATALTPYPVTIAQRIWKDRVHFVSTADDVDTGRSTADPADPAPKLDNPRRMAILLDYAASKAYPATANLRDDAYSSLFTDTERGVGQALSDVWARVDQLPPDSPIASAVRDALDRLGDRDVASS